MPICAPRKVRIGTFPVQINLRQILQLDVPIIASCISVPLSIVIMELFLNRSVQNLNLAALKDR
jgi:hypothetical protein